MDETVTWARAGRCLRARSGVLTATAVMVVGLTVAGCGSSSSSSSSAKSKSTASAGATRSPTSRKLTGSPIKLEVISFVNSVGGNEPQVFAGAEAAARAINAAGGVKGHPVQITTCNSQYQPSDELACARDATTNGSTAVVGSLAFVDSPADLAIWQKANLANVGSLPAVPQDFTSSINFPVINFLSSVACTTSFPKIVGATTTGSPVNELPISTSGYKLDAAAAAGAGNKVVSTLVPTSASDMTSYVEELATKGAQSVFLAIGDAQSPQFIRAASSLGKTWPYCHSDGVMTGGQLIQLGSAVSKFYTGSPLPPLTATTQYPGLKTFISQMAAETAAGDSAASTSVTNYSSDMLESWLAVQAAAQVARKITGPIDHTTFLHQIRHTTVSFDGIIKPINFAKTDPIPGFTRIFNPDVLLIKWNPAKKNFYLVPGSKPFNAAAAVVHR